MRTLLPYLAVLLAIVASGSIAYIAWDLTSERPPRNPGDDTDGGPQDETDAPEKPDN